MMFTKLAIKTILLSLFIGCLFSMPYGYYQFLRLASVVLFGILTFTEYKERNYIPAVLCICAALLFNPVLPVYLENEVWQAIDKITAALLLLWIFIDITLFAIRKRKSASIDNSDDKAIAEPSSAALIKMRTINGSFTGPSVNVASGDRKRSEQEQEEMNN